MKKENLEGVTYFSNTFTKRVYNYAIENFFMFYSYLMLKFGIRPTFTLFQQSISRLLKVTLSQLNPNAWLMLITSSTCANALGNFNQTCLASSSSLHSPYGVESVVGIYILHRKV